MPDTDQTPAPDRRPGPDSGQGPAADRRIDLRRPGFRRPVTFDLVPTAAERAALAAELGLTDLPALRLRGRIEPAGRADAVLSGQLTADVVQPCVVTLAPVPATIAETVVRRYLADWVEPEGDEIEVPEDDTAEPLPPVLDLWALLAEVLALALPLYPRAPGADFAPVIATPPGAVPLSEAARKPFAGLAALRRPAGEPPPGDDGEQG
jgi:uncharacterized metal-binding protein YceD (DUF177 family)